MPERVGVDLLNRCTLARQGLLTRRHGVTATLSVVAGIQAQEPRDPYVALHARVEGFRPQHLEDLILRRKAGRVALMRSTIHLVTAGDALAFRPLVQPAVQRAYAGNHRKHLAGADESQVAAAAVRLLRKSPMVFSDLGRELGKRWPKAKAASLAQAVRARVSLVQVPPRGLWTASGRPLVSTTKEWFREAKAKRLLLDGLVRRYLAAFGPASVADAQTWSGLTGLQRTFHGMDLVRFEGPEGAKLYDVPGGETPDTDTHAPPRFLPVYDNALLGYKDRRRMFSKEMPAFRPNQIVRFVLIEGRVSATWTVKVEKRSVNVTVAPFSDLAHAVKAEVAEEGESLVECLWPELEHKVAWQ